MLLPSGGQIALFGDSFEAAKPGNPIFCHQSYLEKLLEYRNQPIARRAELLLYRLALDERRQFYKSTSGVNAGWRRSRLGGNKGSHFYAWWAPAGAPPIKRSGLSNVPAGAVFVRDIRHHDDHSELTPQTLDDYLPVGVKELLRADDVPLPWTPAQNKFTQARGSVRVLRGHPGSGKTTALWNAAIQAARQAVLYVTYSSDLAALARDYFDKFAPKEIRFEVLTLSRLMTSLSDAKSASGNLQEGRAKMSAVLAGTSPRVFGVWQDYREALFDEIRAHMVGDALPVDVGRFAAQKEPLVTDRVYRERREHYVGRNGAESLVKVVQLLRREGDLAAVFFPDLAQAWRACERLRMANAPNLLAPFLDFDTLAVDEVQDLTPVEALAIIDLAALAGRLRGRPVTFLGAGDEAQTVRPTDFEWGWFHDLLHHRLGSPTPFELIANLRSPRRIADLVNQVNALYSHLPKHERPSGAGAAETDDDASDQITFCSAAPGPDLDLLLDTFADREGLAILSLSDRFPDWLPARIRPRVFTPIEAKGLDFHSVCVLNLGQSLERIQNSQLKRADFTVEPMSLRLAIDRIRVAVSRPAERLYCLEVGTTPLAVALVQELLQQKGEWHAPPPTIPAAVLKSLEEELLPLEERLRLCETDARQFLEVKPTLAWVRAEQAAALLGPEGIEKAREGDPLAQSVLKTAAQIAFCLACRRVPLDSVLGFPNLYAEALSYAAFSGDAGLALIIQHSVAVIKSPTAPKGLFELGEVLADNKESFAPWLEMELAAVLPQWLAELEQLVEQPAWTSRVTELLPRLYPVLRIADADSRAKRLIRRGIDALIQAGQFREALRMLDRHGLDLPLNRAACLEGCAEFGLAAEQYLKGGDPDSALRSFRSIPDLGRSLELVAKIKGHPAAESLEWIRRMQALVAERPANLPKVVTPQELGYLQEILERSLGVQRKPKKVKASGKGAAAKAGGSVSKSKK
jgi:hypothetical protein